MGRSRTVAEAPRPASASWLRHSSSWPAQRPMPVHKLRPPRHPAPPGRTRLAAKAVHRAALRGAGAGSQGSMGTGSTGRRTCPAPAPAWALPRPRYFRLLAGCGGRKFHVEPRPWPRIFDRVGRQRTQRQRRRGFGVQSIHVEPRDGGLLGRRPLGGVHAAAPRN